jgi:hypothetical protein
MRYLFGFVFFLLALGTLRVVGCGDEGPECLQHEDCYDQDACTEDECVNRVCEFRAMTCDDASECAVDSCDPDVGCQYTAVDDGIACDEINECTDGQCVGGVCDAEPLLDGTPCYESNECTDGVCESGVCKLTQLADGTVCGQQGAGICQAGACAGPFPCTESGIREAIAAGGGPLRFTCDGPTTIQTSREIFISKNVILDAEGNLTLDGGGDHRVLNVQAEVTLDGITVTRGYIGNGNGGGIANGGTLTLLNSTVSNSVASLTSRSLKRGYGGGIHNTGTLTLINSTVSGNTARGTWQPYTGICWEGDCGDVFVGGDGGGIDNRGMLFLSNSTVSENHAESIGGGIYNQGGGVGHLANSTVANNVGISDINGPVWLRATLVSGDRPPCFFGVESDGYNIESPGDTCGFDQTTDLFDVTAAELNLGPLQDNGGPTQTHALLPGSVAIDVIPEAMCEVDEDQRGFPRDSMCDVGAFEVQP